MIYDPRTLAAVVAVILAAASFGFTVWSNSQNRKYSQLSVSLANFNMKQARREAIRRWAEDCMDVLSSAYILLKNGNADLEKNTILTKLTSLIDSGRWLLPNNEHEHFGSNKESAYTGLRQNALDDLVDVFIFLEATTSFKDLPLEHANRVMLSKRRFTSAIQQKLEPRVAEAELEELSGTIE